MSRFVAIADTDIGITKDINQDSVLIKHAQTEKEEVLMAIICDGMGGLALGELASASVVRSFSRWFDEELPYELQNLDMQIIAEKWVLLIKELNLKILEYSKDIKGQGIGTTFSGLLIVDDLYLIVHVGDSRVYYIGQDVKQLTIDQTFVAREISRGNMTAEQAKKDKRRNMLLQCIGASKSVEPEVVMGRTQEGTYMLCSDGLRHEITEQEMQQNLKKEILDTKEMMRTNARKLINLAKERNEKDNISVVVIKAE